MEAIRPRPRSWLGKTKGEGLGIFHSQDPRCPRCTMHRRRRDQLHAAQLLWRSTCLCHMSIQSTPSSGCDRVNNTDEYIHNRITQSEDIGNVRGGRQILKWRVLQKYLDGQYLSYDQKLDFIRYSLESWRISNTTIDILFRKMIRWTLPGNVALDCLSIEGNNGYLKKLVFSNTTQGIVYTVSERGCDCPGFRGNDHCKHHDELMDELQLLSAPAPTPSEEVGA